MTTQASQKWHKVLLKDAVTFKTGKLNSNAATKNGKYPFFTCSQEVYKTDTFSFDTECVLLGGNNANAIYPIFYFKGKFDAYQRTYVIESKDNYIRFLYYLLTEKLNELRLQSTGSATKFLTIKILNQLPVNLPDYLTQKQIADVLSIYDDLIDNSTRRIKTLEQIAQAIYTEWFINFNFLDHEKIEMVDSGTDFSKIPKGWGIKKLGDKISISRGKNITKKTIEKGSVPVIAGGLEPAYFHSIPNTQAPVVTVSASGANAGFINLYMENVWASDCSYIDKNVTPFVLYYFLLLKSRQFEVTGLQRGSAQPHVYPKDLAELLVVDVPEHLIELFEKVVGAIFASVGNLKKQNEALRNSRDMLLPKLVTGEIKV